MFFYKGYLHQSAKKAKIFSDEVNFHVVTVLFYYQFPQNILSIYRQIQLPYGMELQSRLDSWLLPMLQPLFWSYFLFVPQVVGKISFSRILFF